MNIGLLQSFFILLAPPEKKAVQDISVFKALAKIDELKAVKSYKHVDKCVFFLKVINASAVNHKFFIRFE